MMILCDTTKSKEKKRIAIRRKRSKKRSNVRHETAATDAGSVPTVTGRAAALGENDSEDEAVVDDERRVKEDEAVVVDERRTQEDEAVVVDELRAK